MSLARTLVLTAATIVGMAQMASGHDHDASCERIFVPAHFDTRVESVTEPGRWVDEQKVIEVPGRYETKVEMVESPGRYEMVERRVWVEGRWVERTGPVAEIGNKRFKIGIALPCREWISGHYETVRERVWVPGSCERREVQVWIPACRRVEVVRVFRPGCTVERPVRVWVPGRFEMRCATARRTIRPEPPRYAPAPAPTGCGTPVHVVLRTPHRRSNGR